MHLDFTASCVNTLLPKHVVLGAGTRREHFRALALHGSDADRGSSGTSRIQRAEVCMGREGVSRFMEAATPR